MTDVKADLRRRTLSRRDLVSPKEAHVAADAVRARALALFDELHAEPDRAVVSVYWPIRSEINTRPLIESLRAKGFTVALPVMSAVRRPLVFREFEPGDDLHKGPFGLSEPSPDKPERDPHIVFSPLAAFDRLGHRLGYGGVIYDATLAALGARHPVTAIGLAYAVQEVEAVPVEPHDQQLSYIVTERETIHCRVPAR